MSEEGGDENKFLIFIGVGIAFLSLGAPDLVLDDSSQLSSWLFVVGGVLFLIAAFGARYEDSSGFRDLS
jgi:uncharacterized membrane protein YwaF